MYIKAFSQKQSRSLTPGSPTFYFCKYSLGHQLIEQSIKDAESRMTSDNSREQHLPKMGEKT